MLLRFAGPLAALLLLSGCATLSDKECLVADWQEQGYRDGRLGYPATRIIKHREACAAVGVVPDGRSYRRGHANGVLEYCTPSNAIREGRAGRRYRNVCPPGLADDFVYFHQLGRDVYQAEEHVKDLDRQVRRLEKKLDKEEDADERKSLRGQLRNLDKQLQRARRALRLAEQRLRLS